MNFYEQSYVTDFLKYVQKINPGIQGFGTMEEQKEPEPTPVETHLMTLLEEADHPLTDAALKEIHRLNDSLQQQKARDLEIVRLKKEVAILTKQSAMSYKTRR